MLRTSICDSRYTILRRSSILISKLWIRRKMRKYFIIRLFFYNSHNYCISNLKNYENFPQSLKYLLTLFCRNGSSRSSMIFARGNVFDNLSCIINISIRFIRTCPKATFVTLNRNPYLIIARGCILGFFKSFIIFAIRLFKIERRVEF